VKEAGEIGGAPLVARPSENKRMKALFLDLGITLL